MKKIYVLFALTVISNNSFTQAVCDGGFTTLTSPTGYSNTSITAPINTQFPLKTNKFDWVNKTAFGLYSSATRDSISSPFYKINNLIILTSGV
jgi:hypothetical protein